VDTVKQTKRGTVPDTLKRSLSLANVLIPKNVSLAFDRPSSPPYPSPTTIAVAAFDAWLEKHFPVSDFPALYKAFVEYSRGNAANRLGIFQACHSSYVHLSEIALAAAMQSLQGLHMAGFMVPEWDGHLKRIRRCEICARFFYASRNNRLTCSPKCKNTRKKRMNRRNKLIYEEARLSANHKISAVKTTRLPIVKKSRSEKARKRGAR
jgi:hypothetical protein